jgi:hypothetical protein
MRRQTIVKWTIPTLMLLAALVSGSCESSDPIAPDGSTISLSVSPDPINLATGGKTTITARVLSANGVPVPDGTVVFFEPSGGTVSVSSPTTTDGVATTELSVATTGNVTINAFSGGVKATRTISVVNANVSTISLSSLDPTIQLQCSDTVDLFGTVQDASSVGVPNLQVTIEVQTSNPAGMTGNFIGSNTDSAGNYSGIWLISKTDCDNNCAGGKSCSVTLRARVVQTVTSPPLVISDNVP